MELLLLGTGCPKVDHKRFGPSNLISSIKEARVLNGASQYFLDFNHNEIQKECLGYLVPNNLLKKYLFKRLKNLKNITMFSKVNFLYLIRTDDLVL